MSCTEKQQISSRRGLATSGERQRHVSKTRTAVAAHAGSQEKSAGAWFSRRVGRVAIEATGKALWRCPGRFGIVRILGRSYALRCIAFHDIAPAESPFTRGMGVSVTPSDFADVLKFVRRYYAPVSLSDVLSDCNGKGLPRRAILVTFDDGYASAIEAAASLCSQFAIPAVFFVNAAFLDNHRLAPDNLVCYAANVAGMKTINAAMRTAMGDGVTELRSMSEVFSRFFPAISLAERQAFLDVLVFLSGINERKLAEESALYLTREQLRDLATAGFEIGNHTYSHVHCRSLTRDLFRHEVQRNSLELEALTGRPVRCFSLPYGSSADLTGDMQTQLERSGHRAIFLSESVANGESTRQSLIDRVSVHARTDEALFLEVEVLPRLRAIRNRMRDMFGLDNRRHASACSTIG